MLEEKKHYESISGKKITIQMPISRERVIMYYGTEILNILGKSDLPWKQRQETLKHEDVMIGLMDDHTIQTWYRHKKSGKCLSVNINGKNEKNKSLLSKFDIQIKDDLFTAMEWKKE